MQARWGVFSERVTSESDLEETPGLFQTKRKKSTSSRTESLSTGTRASQLG